MNIDLGEAAQHMGKVIAGFGAAVTAWLGIARWREARREKLEAFFGTLATKEQVERHKAANDEQVKVLRREIDRLHESQGQQTEALAGLQEAVRDMPLRLLDVLNKRDGR